MRKLDRSSVQAPQCLSQLHHQTHSWDNSPGKTKITSAQKEEIRIKLDELQGRRCAYCERQIPETGPKQQIEHFVQRRNDPSTTFDWDNLFWSCCGNQCCGDTKDRVSYQPGDLLKPDVDDPDDFLRFDYNGNVAPMSQLTPRDHQRATETIRVLALDGGNNPALPAMRRQALKQPKEWAKQICHCFQNPTELADPQVQQLITDEITAKLAEIDKQPFCTSIRHVLTDMLIPA